MGLPMEISQYRLAKDINVPARRINEIVQGKRSITPDTALRLSKYFGLSERFWINLQARYDLESEKDKLKDRLNTYKASSWSVAHGGPYKHLMRWEERRRLFGVPRQELIVLPPILLISHLIVLMISLAFQNLAIFR
jgi:addiction module HigA family antidote